MAPVETARVHVSEVSEVTVTAEQTTCVSAIPAVDRNVTAAGPAVVRAGPKPVPVIVRLATDPMVSDKLGVTAVTVAAAALAVPIPSPAAIVAELKSGLVIFKVLCSAPVPDATVSATLIDVELV
jgi:hypothetical protein